MDPLGLRSHDGTRNCNRIRDRERSHGPDDEQRHSSHPGFHDVDSLPDPNLPSAEHRSHAHALSHFHAHSHGHVAAVEVQDGGGADVPPVRRLSPVPIESAGSSPEPGPSPSPVATAIPLIDRPRPQLHAATAYVPSLPLTNMSSATGETDRPPRRRDDSGDSSEQLLGTARARLGTVRTSQTQGGQNVVDEQAIFELAHARKKKGSGEHQHMKVMNDQDPIQLKHLFKRPVVRQWLYNGNYYREKDERQSSRFELFSDLLFVGVVHQLADGLAEEGAATALNVAKFVLVFYPAFSIWSDMRRQLNMSGTDDCFQRFYVLVIMLILVGYTSNAAGILIFPAHAGTILMSHNQEVGADGSGSATEILAADSGGIDSKRAVALAAEYGLRSLIRRAEEGGQSERPVLVEAIGNTGYWFAEGYHRAVYSSIAFYLSAKVLKLLVHFVYGLMLPKFRTALWVEMVPIFLLGCTYLPLAFIYNPGWICAIIVAGITIDIFSKYLINGFLQRVHRYYKRKGKPIFIPAQSVEHIAERTVLFVVLVTGECILNSTFVATHEHYGLSTQLLRASLSVINSFYLVWIYFDCDASRTFLHALRVNPWSAITFSLLHYPLCAALILLSSSIPRLVKNSSSEMGYRWFYAASMSVAMLCMATIGLLHRNLDIAGSAYWSQRARIAFRLVCSAGFALLPLGGEDWNNLEFLLAYNVILGLLVFSETAGKLGVVGRKFDQAKADAYYAALKGGGSDPEEKRSAEEVFKALQEGLEASASAQDAHADLKRLSDVHFSPLRVDMRQHFSPGPAQSLHGILEEGKRQDQQEIAGQYPPQLTAQSYTTGPATGQSHTLRSRASIISQTAADLVKRVDGALNPHTSRVKLSKKDDWHPYEDLMGDERGDEDVGVEGELGQMEVKERMDAGQRWALVAN